MIIEGLLIIIITPFSDIEIRRQIIVYCILIPILLLFLFIEYNQYRNTYVKWFRTVFSVLIQVYFIESYMAIESIQMLMISALTIQIAQLQIEKANNLIMIILNLYQVFRINDWKNINFSQLIIGICFVFLIAYRKCRKRDAHSNFQENNGQQNIGTSQHQKYTNERSIQQIQSNLLLNEQLKQQKNLFDSTCITTDLQEYFHVFNLISDGFALLCPQTLQVTFCNQAALEIFHIQDKADFKQCVESLVDVIPTTSKEIRKNSENREYRDSFPSFHSFHQNLGALQNRQIRQPSRHKISIQFSKKQMDESQTPTNQIINDLKMIKSDKRYLSFLKTQPYATSQIGQYLAYWYQKSVSITNEDTYLKRLLEIYSNQTIIDNRVTILIQVRDVTHREYINSIRQEYKARSNTISYVSHEYRAPLNSIIQYINALYDGYDTDNQKRYLKIALNNCQYLLNLSNDLLDFAQLKVGRFSVVPVQFNLHDLITECFDMYTLQAQLKNIKLILSYRTTLPSLVYNDPNRIRQVIVNLLGNAFKFTLQGNIELKVNKENDNLLKIEVSDTGIGIEKEDQSKLIQAFGKIMHSEHKKLNQQGVGLGLLISSIISTCLNSGEKGLEFESEYHQGSAFWFYVSINIDQTIQVSDNIDDEYLVNDSSDKRQSLWKYILKPVIRTTQCECVPILVVDDNAFNIDVLKLLINKLKPNHIVHCCLDGQKAVQMVQKNRCQRCNGYKVIFMDIEMPRMNGFEATAIIKKQYPEIKVYGCSAYSKQIEEKRAKENGMDGYLVKPLQLDQLKVILDEIK